MRKFIKYFIIGVCSALVVLVLLATYLIVPIWSNLPSGAELRQLSETVETRLDEMPEYVQLALLAAEQPDSLIEGPSAISSVITQFVKGCDDGSCGSTISMKVARNIFTNQRQLVRHPNWAFRHFIMTVKVEHYLTPEQILELSLSQIYFGPNTFGIAQAARFFFDKDPANLLLSESALLAGLVKAPTRYSPISRPERALERRNHVLQLMVKHDMITDSESTAAMAEPLGVSR